MVTQSTAKPEVGRLVAYVDCGNAVGDHDAPHQHDPGTTNATPHRDEINGKTAEMRAMGETNRWRRGDGTYQYHVDVPYRGEYDVTLVFCETHDFGYGKGNRVTLLCGGVSLGSSTSWTSSIGWARRLCWS